MKFIITIVMAMIYSSPIFATLPEISPWQQYPVTNIPEDVSISETVTLEMQWKLDCSDSSETLFGKIVSASPGIDGRTLLFDSQLVQVVVINPEGVIENVVGRPGEGPGELSGAFRGFQLIDGRIGISDGAPALSNRLGGMGKITLFAPSGDPAGLWYGAGKPGDFAMSSIRELRCSNDHILSASQRIEMSHIAMSNILELSYFDSSDGSRTVIARHVFEDKMEIEMVREEDLYEPFAHGRCDISSTGQIAFAPLRNPWTVVIRNPNGEGLVLNRPWPSHPREQSELEAVQKALGAPNHNGLFKNKPAVGSIRWLPNGKLWIEALGIDPAPGAFACYDEFSTSGQLLRRIQLVVPGDPETDELIILENGRFVLLKGFIDNGGNKSDVLLNPEVILLKVDVMRLKEKK